MKGSGINVLLIEDSREQVQLLVQVLAHSDSAEDFRLIATSSLAEGVARLASKDIGLILLDLILPDSQGLPTFLSVIAAAPEVPIVILSGSGDVSQALEMVRLGAQDYLVKGHVDNHLLVRAMRYALERMRTQHELRRTYEELEVRVRERTLQLEQTNARLQQEIRDRQRAEVKTLESNRQLAAAIEQLRTSQEHPPTEASPPAMSPLAEGVVNDFNNALAPILGFSDLLLHSPNAMADPGQVREHLTAIHNAAEESAKVVRRLQEFYRPPGPVEPVPPDGSQGRTPADGAVPRKEAPACRHGLRILVVEDEPMVREILQLFLSEDQHQTVMAVDGVDGLERFQDGTFDLVLTDRAMPRMNGQQFAQEVRKLRPQQPVIMLTGLGDMTAGSPEAEGIDLVVGKPFTLPILRRAISQVLGL